MTNKIKVSNMESSRGNKIANQFIITVEGEGQYFQSYDSVIAFVKEGHYTTLDEKYWNYSNTTGKYRNLFLGESKAETMAKIKSGEYKFANLN